MSDLRFTESIYPAQSMNGESSLPSLSNLSAVAWIPETNLDEEDNLFCGYGSVHSPFPYRMQDMYTRTLVDTKFITPVLENEYLRAVFMPSFGGKLWSLYDKISGRELLMSNPVVRPCNLAIRNAWTSGGVEWNCGFLGHHPHTCSQIYTARTSLDDGTPVLRMYEYERVRGVTYQMDFFLPDKSKMLFCRMRLTNENPVVVPIYWWSNIAVPELKNARVIAPVTHSYTFVDGKVAKAPVPNYLDTDITYPVNLGFAVDFFWKIPNERRKFICQLDSEGYGLIQTSTSRLRGRKLFVWGQGSGGTRWQNYLTADGYNGRYVEIQAGLAHTQYESLPMNPRSSWEWIEAYGALKANASAVHGEWENCVCETENKLNDIITEQDLEKLLHSTRIMAKSKAEELILQGSGFGSLENKRRLKAGEQLLSPHLDFSDCGEEQKSWIDLLQYGSFGKISPDDVPLSWMSDEKWVKILKTAVKAGPDEYNWYTWLQYGASLTAQIKFDEAKEALDTSMKLCPSAWALYCLGCIAKVQGDLNRAAALMLQALNLKPDDISLAKEAISIQMSLAGKAPEFEKENAYERITKFIEILPEHIKDIPRVKLSLAEAYLKSGNIVLAENLLYSGGGLLVADIREGELSVTELWYSIEEKKAQAKNLPFDRSTAEIPAVFDFRMKQ